MSDEALKTSPVGKFLGEDAARGGPFALLGVDPARCDDDSVLVALNQRLDVLARHAHRDTPEGGEVVLALHAAAAQLLDPSMRRQLITEWTGVAPEVPHDNPPSAPEPENVAREILEDQATGARRASTPSLPAPVGAIDRRLEAEAATLLALSGGWTPHALQRLTQFALANGLEPGEVVRALQSAGRSARLDPPPAPRLAPSVPVPTAAPAPAPRTLSVSRAGPEELASYEDAQRVNAVRASNRAIAIVFLSLSALLVAGITGVIYIVDAVLSSATETPKSGAETAQAPAPSPSESEIPDLLAPIVKPTPEAATPEATPAEPDQEPVPAVDARDVPRQLRMAASLAPDSPGKALDMLAPLVESVSARWASLSPEELVAVNQSLIEIAYACTRSPDNAERFVEIVARPLASLNAGNGVSPRQLTSAAWSAGVLTRLLGERELPQAVIARATSALTAALGVTRPTGDDTFRHGALTMLGVLRSPMAQRPAAPSWQAWVEASSALDPKDAEGSNRRLMGALESVLLHGPDPLSDEATSQSIALLVRAITWRPGDESRPRLLAWFRDPRLTTNDLRAVTYSLARETNAVGIDITMVVPLSASSQVKRSIAERIAVSWGLDQSDAQASLVAEWALLARSVVAAPSPEGESELLEATAGIARVNAWASWIWRGEADAARADMAGERNPTPASTTRPVSAGQLFVDAAITVGGADWAERYLDAKRNIPVRLALLDEAVNRHLSALDAELIARDALREDRVAVRKKAQQLVAQHAGEPVMVNALLEVLPDARSSEETSGLIEVVTSHRLPPHTGERWARAARRALVERLLELVARDGSFAAIDRQAERLTASYALRAAATPDAAGTMLNSPPELLVGLEWTRLRADAQRAVRPEGLDLSIAAIERSRSDRIRTARGVVQIFQAQQLAVLETLAYTVAAENPDQIGRVSEILKEVDARRASSPHVLQQLHFVEQSIVRLWIIRLGEVAHDVN